MKMNRILHYIGSLNRGGAQSAVLNFYKHVDRNLYQFDFVSDHPDEIELEENIRSLGGRIFYTERLRGANLLGFVESWKYLFESHPEYRVIHIHVRSTSSIVACIAKAYGVSVIVHSHSTSNGDGMGAIVKNTLQYPARWVADYCIGCSSEAGNWMFGPRVCASSKYLYLPNAIDLSEYSFSKTAREDLRRELGLENVYVFGHVGRLHEAKNHKFLIKVFVGLKKKYENSALVLVGDGPLRGDIESTIKELNMEDSIYLLGDRSDVPRILSAFDSFLFPSRWEGLPVSVVEALAAGLPCYVSDSITHDIDISDRVKRLSIESERTWVEGVSLDERKDVTDCIVRHGFDIRQSVMTLMNLYDRAICKSGKREDTCGG